MTMLSLAEARRIANVRAPWCVTIYGDADVWLGPHRAGEPTDGEIRRASRALMEEQASEEMIAIVRDHLERAASSPGLGTTEPRHRGRSVGIFVTSEECDVFPLTTQASPGVTVSDRFDVAQLVDAALGLTARVFVLAVSDDDVRLVDVTAHPGRIIDVLPGPGVRRGAPATTSRGVSASSSSGLADGDMRRLRAYAESLIRRVAPLVHEAGAMLAILAAEPLASMLEAEVILHSSVSSQILRSRPDSADPRDLSVDQLVDLARPVVDEQKERARRAELSRLSEADPVMALRDIAAADAFLQEAAAAALVTRPDALNPRRESAPPPPTRT